MQETPRTSTLFNEAEYSTHERGGLLDQKGRNENKEEMSLEK